MTANRPYESTGSVGRGDRKDVRYPGGHGYWLAPGRPYDGLAPVASPNAAHDDTREDPISTPPHRPSVTFALDVLDAMIREEAKAANLAALARPDFDRLRMGTGPGLRLEALSEAKARIVSEALAAKACQHDGDWDQLESGDFRCEECDALLGNPNAR